MTGAERMVVVVIYFFSAVFGGVAWAASAPPLLVSEPFFAGLLRIVVAVRNDRRATRRLLGRWLRVATVKSGLPIGAARRLM